MKIVATVAVAAALLSTAACGSSRPSVDELADAILEQGKDAGIDADIAACLAEVYHESDISDDTLNDIVNNDIDVNGTAAIPEGDDEALTDITDQIMECASTATP